MTPVDPDRDLVLTRTIRASRDIVWRAMTEPELFAQWWIPAPTACRVAEMVVAPGGALRTEMSDDGGPFVPHLDACYLDVVPCQRLVFTNALTKGFRPAAEPFITAVISLSDVEGGTGYHAHVMHKDPATQKLHAELGFYDGWGTVAAQLAALVERQ